MPSRNSKPKRPKSVWVKWNDEAGYGYAYYERFPKEETVRYLRADLIPSRMMTRMQMAIAKQARHVHRQTNWAKYDAALRTLWKIVDRYALARRNQNKSGMEK